MYNAQNSAYSLFEVHLYAYCILLKDTTLNGINIATYVFLITGPDHTDAYLEIFDLDNCEWHKQLTFGSFPRLGNSSCYGVIGSTLYIIGGMNDLAYFDETYALNLETFKWTSLPNAPLERALGGCVVHGTALFTLGGVGNKPMQEGTRG